MDYLNLVYCPDCGQTSLVVLLDTRCWQMNWSGDGTSNTLLILLGSLAPLHTVAHGIPLCLLAGIGSSFCSPSWIKRKFLELFVDHVSESDFGNHRAWTSTVR